MKLLLETINHPADALWHGKKSVSWGMVIIAVLINSLVSPVLYYVKSNGADSINWLQMLKITCFGIGAYVIACSVIWLICLCFGSKVSWYGHIKSWGLTFAPNIVCSIVVIVTEVFFDTFWNSIVWGMILSIVYVGILLWKALLFIIYLKEYVQIKGWRIFGAGAVLIVLILLMAAGQGYLGIRTPMI